jgi:hypothetical protein
VGGFDGVETELGAANFSSEDRFHRGTTPPHGQGPPQRTVVSKTSHQALLIPLFALRQLFLSLGHGTCQLVVASNGAVVPWPPLFIGPRVYGDGPAAVRSSLGGAEQCV